MYQKNASWVLKMFGKRGAISPSMTALIEVVLSLIALFLLLVLGSKLLAFLTGIADISEGEVASFDSIKESIPILLDSEDDQCFVKFYVGDGSIFAGWGSGESLISTSGGDLARNVKCRKDKSCVVMCNVGKGKLFNSNSGVDSDDCQKNIYQIRGSLALYELPSNFTRIKLLRQNKESSVAIYGAEDEGLKNMLLRKKGDLLEFVLSPGSLSGIEECRQLKYLKIEP